MRTSDKVRIVERFKAGESTSDLCLGRVCVDCGKNGVWCEVDSAIREAMNGAPWWPPSVRTRTGLLSGVTTRRGPTFKGTK